jgi:hypothetical protein
MHPILLRITRLLVGRRASGFVLVVQCLGMDERTAPERANGVLLQALKLTVIGLTAWWAIWAMFPYVASHFTRL